ncbi:MAG: hypothetical protein ACOYO1_18295 [Bacteroidales bacterium]
MKLYDFLLENESLVKILQENNVLPKSINGYIEIYKNVLTELETGKSKTDSYFEIAEQMGIHPNTVINAVVKMQEQI